MTDQKKGQPNKASPEKTHVENTSGTAQRARLLERLQAGPIDTFTEEEARVSADLMRGTFRGARASETIYNRVWNYDPRQEQLTIDQARMSRAVLAIRLGLPAPSITV